jgi:hypothetical protein
MNNKYQMRDNRSLPDSDGIMEEEYVSGQVVEETAIAKAQTQVGPEIRNFKCTFQQKVRHADKKSIHRTHVRIEIYVCIYTYI